MPSRYYTRIVWLSKHFLWLLVAGVIGIVVWIASDNTGSNGARIVFSNIAKSGNLQNIMDKPHYQGVDSHNHPYTVVADHAIQLDKDNVSLDAIRADIMMEDSQWIALNALAGQFNAATQGLELSGGIDVFYGNGYEFRTDHAQVDIADSSAYGDAPVEIQAPMGTLSATGFSIADGGQVIKFNKSVKVKIYR